VQNRLQNSEIETFHYIPRDNYPQLAQKGTPQVVVSSRWSK